MGLTTSVVEEAGSARLCVAGEIDIANIDEFDAALCALLAEASSAVLDLTEVTHFGSTAIGALICAHTLAGERAVRMVIRPSPIVRRVLEITSLDRTFALADASS
jgi:anti-anti-sigma factor